MPVQLYDDSIKGKEYIFELVVLVYYFGLFYLDFLACYFIFLFSSNSLLLFPVTKRQEHKTFPAVNDLGAAVSISRSSCLYPRSWMPCEAVSAAGFWYW